MSKAKILGKKAVREKSSCLAFAFSLTSKLAKSIPKAFGRNLAIDGLPSALCSRRPSGPAFTTYYQLFYPKHLLIVSLLSFLLISCDNKTVFEGKKDMKDGYWLYKEPVYFSFEIEDSDTPYDLSFFVRNTIDYPYQNLYLQYYLEDSTGNVLKEKLHNVLLFNEKTGEPLGSGIGDIFNLEKVLLNGYYFPKASQYRMRLDQFMRHDTLRNIRSVGFKIRKASSSKDN